MDTIFSEAWCRDRLVNVPSQCEGKLQCNVVSLAGRIHKMIPDGESVARAGSGFTYCDFEACRVPKSKVAVV